MGVKLKSFFLSLTLRIVFFFKSHTTGISEKYIRRLYINLINLDWEDFVEVGDFEVKAFGQTVHIRAVRCGVEYTLNNSKNDQIYIHEKVDAGEWHEVYRSHYAINSIRFYSFLKILHHTMDLAAKEMEGSVTPPIVVDTTKCFVRH